MATHTGTATARSQRRDPPSLNEYWSTFPNTKSSNEHAAATEDGEAAPSTDTVATTHDASTSQPRSVEGTTPIISNGRGSNSKHSGRPLVLHSGEAIDAKNTLRSNSMLRVSLTNEANSNRPLNSDANEGNADATRDVFANACLLDEEDGVVSIPPILIASSSTNPLPLQSSRSPDDTAAVSRLQVPKKWIPCMLVSILVAFGAGAAAGICGAGLCSSSESATSADRTAASENDNAPVSGSVNATSTTAPMNSPTSALSGTSAPTGPRPPPEIPGEMVPPTPAPVTPWPTPVPVTPLPTPVLDPVEVEAQPTEPPAPTPNNDQPAADIVMFINSITLSGQSLSYPMDPNSMSSTEALALQWIIETDPLQLVPDSPAHQFRLRQRYALRTLWVQQDEERRGALAWDQNDECEWSGIACTAFDGQGIGTGSAVTTINIVQRILVGTISAEMGLLWALEKIDLWNNQIGGTLPAALGSLINLQYFAVEANTVTGTLPESIGQWTNMRKFFVANNMMTGTIPSSLSSWTVIEEARLEQNGFTGAVPDGVCTAVVDCNCDTILLSCALDVECSCCTVCNNQFGMDVSLV